MHAGWTEVLGAVDPLRRHAIPKLVKTFKRFYFAGGPASFAFARSVVAALDEGDEPTEADLSKIDALMHEINEYFTEVAAGRQ